MCMCVCGVGSWCVGAEAVVAPAQRQRNSSGCGLSILPLQHPPVPSMVVTDEAAKMSRTDEVHRITENVYKTRDCNL
uniref:Secreted protein n=1 Tax=Knipowitschia caucasica TaxID=637954 RepID=A0AAV2LH09_KNICA